MHSQAAWLCSDLTGEPLFMRNMIDEHHAVAEAKGVRIVPCCGFDCIPSEVGALLAIDHLKTQHNKSAGEVAYVMGDSAPLLLDTAVSLLHIVQAAWVAFMYVEHMFLQPSALEFHRPLGFLALLLMLTLCAARGGVSGGTIESAVNMLKQDTSVVKQMGHPYYLVPELAGKAVSSLPDTGVSMMPTKSEAAQGWYGPFIMASCNELVVRRSNSLLGYGAFLS
jgi:short subunit dehydrogenase-like uncharacterized protein